MQRKSAIKNIEGFTLALILALAMLLSTPASALTLTVTKTTDTDDSVCDADCSLREAVKVANSGDIITFDPSLNGQTITLFNGMIAINKNLTIQGPGASQLTLSGNSNSKIFWISNTSATVVIDGLTLTHGRHDPGGAIDNSTDGGGNLTVSNCILTGNTTTWSDGGAIANSNTLTLLNSTLSNNTAVRDGGAIWSQGTLNITNSTLSGNTSTGDGGGLLAWNGAATVTNSRILSNTALGGGGLATGWSSLTLINSVLSDNQSNSNIGHAGGGGIFNSWGGTVQVVNSTLSGNRSPNNTGGGIDNYNSVTVTNSTLTGNTAQYGGGVYTEGALTLGNSLVAGNTASINGNEVRATSNSTLTSQGYNLIGFNSVIGISASGSNNYPQTGDLTPALALNSIINTSLANNGGLTETHALATGSPAINAGNDALANTAGLSTDQRGLSRFVGVVDIGSYEVQSAVVNGACGASAGQTFTSAPSSNLCTSGSPSSVTTNPGTFTWSCTGSGSGSTASCSASRAFTVTPSASAQGSITPNTPVTVAYNATRTFTVTPNAGYIASLDGTCGGSLNAVTQIYTTNPITANCTVIADFIAQTYTVTATAGANGAISPGSALVSHNQTTTFTVTPSTGYTASVSGCNGSLSGNTYTTGPITANCTVSATFSQASYTVTATAGANGAISPASRTVSYGSTTTFTVTPNSGYTATVTGCNGSLSGNTYTTGPITANCTVSAAFTLKTYTVTATASANGSLTPTSRTVNHGAAATFTVAPNSGYTATITGCSGALSGNTYTTGPITANCAVSATFNPNIINFTVTAGAGANGAINPARQEVAPGATATFTVTPNPGFIAQVAGCNGTLSGNTYTTGSVNAPCQVIATFAPTPTASVPVLTTPVLPDALVGVPYAVALTAIGGQYPYTYTATNLPPGLTLTAEGVLHGALTASGAFAVTATVTDALGQRSARGYALTVGAGLALATADLPDALVNVPYTQTLAAVGGHPPYTFTATGLPAGFSLSPNGALRGTPVERGHAAVQLTVTDTLNQRATKDLVLTVRAATFTQPNPEQPAQNISGASTVESCPAANVSTRTLKLGDPDAPATGPDGVALLYGLLEIKVTGCQPGQTVLALTTVYPEPLPPGTQYWKYGPTRDNEEPHWYVLPGTIIQGNAITLVIVDGDIGDSDLDVDGNILDPGGPGITRNTIDGAVPAVLPIGEPYRAEFQALCEQGRCPADSAYNWSLAAGALPDGLTLTSNGATATLTGVPTRMGSYPFTVQVLARDASPIPTQKTYTVRITDGGPDPAATTLITHYYVSILEREPEAEGLAFWQGLIADRQAQGIDVKPVFRDMANFFFNSPEYLGRNTTDRQFITNLYLTFFQREPDEGGYAFWLDQLANGMIRNTAMAGFLYSQEFTDFMEGLGF